MASQGDGPTSPLPRFGMAHANVGESGEDTPLAIYKRRRVSISGAPSPVLHDNAVCEGERRRKMPLQALVPPSFTVEARETCFSHKKLSGPPAFSTDAAKVAALRQYVDKYISSSPTDCPQRVRVCGGTCIRYALHGDRSIRVGAGNNGVVYAGYARKVDGTEVPVAIKVFRNLKWQNLDTVIQEASLMAHLSSTGVTPRCGGLVPLESNRSFLSVALVSQFLGNEDTFTAYPLPWLINAHQEARENQYPAGQVQLTRLAWLRLVSDLISALDAVHAKGVVLNDFKMSNIVVKRMATGRWTPYIVDFGSARPCGTDLGLGSRWTEEERSKVPHVAPELVHIAGSVCAPATDLYSLGCLMEQLGHVVRVQLIEDVGMDLSNPEPDLRATMEEVKGLLDQAVARAVMFRRVRAK